MTKKEDEWYKKDKAKSKEEWYYQRKDTRQKAIIKALLFFIMSLTISLFFIWIIHGGS